MKKLNLANVVLVIGFGLSFLLGVVGYFYPQSQDVSNAFILGLIGISCTLIFEALVRLSELKKYVEEHIADLQVENKILEGKQDAIFIDKYRQLKDEIRQLASGRYYLYSLSDVYKDDIESMKILRRGEHLLSMCPISTVSKEEVLNQISDPYYIESVRQHIACAKRGVQVTKVYQIKDKSFYLSELKAHLLELVRCRVDVRIIFRDELKSRLENIDIVIFGSKKASAGIVDVDTGVCTGSCIDTDPRTVEKYAREYKLIANLAHKYNDL